MLAEVPIVVKNSFLMNALLMELQQQLTLDVGGTQFLDLGTAGQALNWILKRLSQEILW